MFPRSAVIAWLAGDESAEARKHLELALAAITRVLAGARTHKEAYPLSEDELDRLDDFATNLAELIHPGSTATEGEA